MPTQTKYLTRAEAAERLGVTERTIDNYLRGGLLSRHQPAAPPPDLDYRVKTFIPAEDVERVRAARALVGPRTVRKAG